MPTSAHTAVMNAPFVGVQLAPGLAMVLRNFPGPLGSTTLATCVYDDEKPVVFTVRRDHYGRTF